MKTYQCKMCGLLWGVSEKIGCEAEAYICPYCSDRLRAERKKRQSKEKRR